MATYYIDPSASTNGNGAFATPYNAWSAATISASNTYLQKAGTTYSGGITIPVGATDVILGVYEAAAGARITDGSQKAYVNGAGTTLTVRIRETSHRCLIDGFEVYGTDTGAEQWAFYLGNTASAPANNTILRNCVARDIVGSGTNDCGGVKVFGSYVTIEDCVIHDVPTDGIFLQGTNALIQRCDIRRVGNDGRDFGDCIQITGNATLGCSMARIYGCYLDHNGGSYKQTLIIQDTTGGSIGCVVERNIMLMAQYDGTVSNALYIDVSKSVVRGNEIVGGYYGIYLNDGTAFISGNVIRNAYYGVNQGSAEAGAQIYNNVITGCASYGVYADQDTTLIVKNNIITRCGTGLAMETGATEDYNLYHGNTTDQASLGGAGPSWGANDIFTDPAPYMTESYRLRYDVTSPLMNGGTYSQGIQLRNGRMRPNVVPIGAYAALLPRTART